MNLKRKILLLLLGLFIALISSWWINAPGYMDADYYFATAKVIASGGGLSEPFLWNYLDNPAELPHSAFQYWMPMTGFLAALSQSIFGVGFRAAQLPFILFTAILPLFTASVAYRLLNNAQLAWQSGLLASVPGLFLPFLVTTDSFSIYGILGPLVFISIVEAFKDGSYSRWLIPGFLTGLAHLTRVDGVLFLLIGMGLAIYSTQSKGRSIAGLLSGYFMIMFPWWAINWAITGSPLATGTSRVLWSTTYDQLFAFPPEKLAFQEWVNSGLGNILLVRGEALWENLKSLFLVNGVIFLSPFMILGAWNLRRNLTVRLVMIYLFLLIVLMSFLFPFAGPRGGFFHSSMAVMPILWALAPLGLKIAIEKGVEIRNWQRDQAVEVFVIAAIVFAVIITSVLFWTRVVGEDYLNPRWSANERVYSEAASWIGNKGVDEAVVAINNPPGFYTQSGLQAVVIPDGDESVLRQVVEKFNVDWVLLDRRNPGLNSLYENPDSENWLELAHILKDVQGENLFIFKVNMEQP